MEHHLETADKDALSPAETRLIDLIAEIVVAQILGEMPPSPKLTPKLTPGHTP